jgi:hypothetical protein
MIRIRSQIFFYCGIESGEPSQFFLEKNAMKKGGLNTILYWSKHTKFGSILELHYNIHSIALYLDKLNNVSPYH